MVSAASSTATTSLVTALGGGSGIDMTALANNLATAQYANRSERLTARSETLDRQISASAKLKSMLLSLSSSLGERVRSGDLSPQPQIASGAVAQASLTGSSVPTGRYNLEVTELAAAQTLASTPLAAPASLIGSGTLILRFGTVSANGFSEDVAHAAVDITVAAGTSLAGIAQAINAKGAGVSAYVAATTEGARLVLKGKDGAANGFVIEAAEDPGDPGLAALAWTPASGDPAKKLASAADAQFKIDGLPMTATSNTISEAIPGVKLVLTAPNPGAPTLVSFNNPASAVTTAMSDLTAALNEVMAEVNQDTNPLSGDLARDGGARALKRTMAALAGTIIMQNAADVSPRTLADLGLSTQRDGSFALDGARLAATLKTSPEGAAAMFTNGLRGVFATIDGLVRGVTKASDPGTLAGSITRYSAQKTQLSEELAKLIETQEKLRASLVTRFAVSEGRITGSKATLSMIQNQIAAWNAKNN